jgi:hypothetical protein
VCAGLDAAWWFFGAMARVLLPDNMSAMVQRADELRVIAVGRGAWLFVGSDDHAQATANIFTLITSCKLHRLDPEDLTDSVPSPPRST